MAEHARGNENLNKTIQSEQNATLSHTYPASSESTELQESEIKIEQRWSTNVSTHTMNTHEDSSIDLPLDSKENTSGAGQATR